MIDGIVDFHVHSGPSILPRRRDDPDAVAEARGTGVDRLVLKAHEGSTAERAALAGAGISGGIVLNSPVGGCNPDAVEVCARLGGRVVWLPTVSSAAHQAAAGSAALAVHRGVRLRQVPVLDDGAPARGLDEVLDLVAAHDLILASGHVPVGDAVRIFQAAHARGARRFLVNHPTFDFMNWNDDLFDPLAKLDVRLEVGCVADLDTTPADSPTMRLATAYPTSLLVLGSDLGHTSFPDYREGLTTWFRGLAPHLGEEALHPDHGRERPIVPGRVGRGRALGATSGLGRSVPCATADQRRRGSVQSPFWSPLTTDHRGRQPSRVMIDPAPKGHLTSTDAYRRR
ncbi:DUF6282 family protein [Pseudonocardia xishanensis]|uniref:TIM-barrel fold metal-dependent hydrolase n=1 Tax=Pseudonocardia xishanensis TaxID=630995 RepID=A0ABP8RID2_9PSEU